jgi:hypothetical protein
MRTDFTVECIPGNVLPCEFRKHFASEQMYVCNQSPKLARAEKCAPLQDTHKMVFDIHRGTFVMLFAYFHERLCVCHHEAAQRIHIFHQVKHFCDKLLLCRMILKTSPKIFVRVGHNP